MVEGLAETETGVKDDIVKTSLVEHGNPVGKEFTNIFYNILIDRIQLHGLRRTLNMHHDIRNTRLGNKIKHAVIHRSSGNIIDNDISQTIDYFARHGRAKGIDGHHHIQIVLPHKLNRPCQTCQLLLFIDKSSSRTSGISSYVYDACTLLHNLVNTFDYLHFADIFAAIIK